jgi:hypothetical protein
MMYLTQISLCYNLVHMYFIKFPIERIYLKTLLISQFEMYLLLLYYKVVFQIGI